ncbi:hypothetical protein BDZ91DRAFT_713805 [Kalaharituber pfeilii]|nr:hypothetical protein BDZ91DRAFT_713805 [Kalaharituber pfeilii]
MAPQGPIPEPNAASDHTIAAAPAPIAPAEHQLKSTVTNDRETPAARKLFTLVIPVDLEKGTVVLGYKKRGFGVGKYNGYGGKFEPSDPDLPSSACRELSEESTLSISPSSLLPIGILFLESIAPLSLPSPLPPPDPSSVDLQCYPATNNALPILEIHVYLAPLHLCTGTPVETDEMRPKTFSYLSHTPNHSTLLPAEPHYPPIPYSEMWSEASHWLTQLLCRLPPPISPPPQIEKILAPPYSFLHHVIFIGDISPNTHEWDPWERLYKSQLVTLESQDLGEWDEEKRGMWVEERRSERWWLGDGGRVGVWGD